MRLRSVLWTIIIAGLVLSFSINLLLIKSPQKAINWKYAIKNQLGITEVSKSDIAPKVIEHFNKNFKAQSTVQIDGVRKWVNSNSTHDESIPMDTSTVFTNPDVTVNRCFDFSTTGGKAPNLSCGPRAFAMRKILLHLGYETRVVTVFLPNYSPTALSSHTFLEVLNPETNTFEIQDPDHNIVYVSTENNRRLNMLNICGMDTSEFYPVKSKVLYGWDETGEYLQKQPDAYRIFRYQYFGQNKQRDLVFADMRYVDESKTYSNTGSKNLLEYISPERQVVKY